MSKPRKCNDLNKNELKRKEKLLQIPIGDRTEAENERLEFLKKKREVFLDPPLSENAKNFLIEIYSRDRYNIRKAAISRQKPSIAKGYFLEREGLQLLSSIDRVEYLKCKEIVFDDYFYGTCDILCPSGNKIIDIKTSWNATTFMQSRKNQLPAKAWWQMQGYLHLYKIQKGEVCYVLINTPQHLIDQEQANLFRRYTYGEITRDKYDTEYEKLQSLYNYDKIPKTKRVIRFEIDYEPDYIDKAKRKVDLSRVWLNEFEAAFIQNKNILTLAEEYIKNAEEDNTESDTAEPLSSDEG